MKKQIGITMGACLALLIGLSLLAFGAQERVAKTGGQDKKVKPISAADQRAIQELFKDVDPSKYRLQFNRGKRVIGNKKVEMQDMEQVRKFRNPGEAAGFWAIIVKGNDKEIIYIIATDLDKLKSVLGVEKTARLQQIMAKYAR